MKELLKTILKRAAALGLAQQDLDLARDFLRRHEFGLCLDTLVTQIVEGEIRVDEAFYSEVEEAARRIGLAQEKVERVKELIP